MPPNKVGPPAGEAVEVPSVDFAKHDARTGRSGQLAGQDAVRQPYLEASPYEADGGELIGKHPREVALDELRVLPAPQSYPKAIRAKCIDCCAGQPSEVRKCVAVTCHLWPYRMGFSPYHARSRHNQNAVGLEGSFQTAAADLSETEQ